MFQPSLWNFGAQLEILSLFYFRKSHTSNQNVYQRLLRLAYFLEAQKLKFKK